MERLIESQKYPLKTAGIFLIYKQHIDHYYQLRAQSVLEKYNKHRYGGNVSTRGRDS